MNRIKADISPIADTRAFSALVDEIASIQLVLEDIKTTHNLQKQEAEKAFKGRVTRLETKLVEKFAIANMYATNNREELLGSEKSKKSTRAVFGFRKASGALKFLKGWTEAKIIAAIKASELVGFFQTVEKLNKVTLKNGMSPALLEQHGMYIDAGDKFFIEPTRDEAINTERISS